MLTWLLLVAVVGVAVVTEGRRYDYKAYVEECTGDDVELTPGTITMVEFTKKKAGELLSLKGAKYCKYSFQYGSGEKMGLHLVDSDTLPPDELAKKLGVYFPIDTSGHLDYTVKTPTEKIEKIELTRNIGENPRTTYPVTTPPEVISFKLTGDYVYNNMHVRPWRIVHMLWSVHSEIYDDIDEHPPTPLRTNCSGTFIHGMNDPTTTYIHHHETPYHMIDISDCRVDIETSDDTYALQYQVLYNSTDVYQYMTNETIIMSYKPRYHSDYQVFRTYKTNDTIPAMLDLPLPDKKTGVYGIRYELITNGVNRQIFAGLLFTISTIKDPIKITLPPITGQSTEEIVVKERRMGAHMSGGGFMELVNDTDMEPRVLETSTVVSTVRSTSRVPTPAHPTPEHPTPTLPPYNPRRIAYQKSDDAVTQSTTSSSLIPLYVLAALIGFVAIVALAAYLSNWNNRHWQPNRIRHNQFDWNDGNHIVQISGNTTECKSSNL